MSMSSIDRLALVLSALGCRTGIDIQCAADGVDVSLPKLHFTERGYFRGKNVEDAASKALDKIRDQALKEAVLMQARSTQLLECFDMTPSEKVARDLLKRALDENERILAVLERWWKEKQLDPQLVKELIAEIESVGK